jgi:hypothetical protein
MLVAPLIREPSRVVSKGRVLVPTQPNFFHDLSSYTFLQRFGRKGEHQRVTYNAFVKKLIVDANRFTGFGDAAPMLMSNHEIDLEFIVQMSLLFQRRGKIGKLDRRQRTRNTKTTYTSGRSVNTCTEVHIRGTYAS